MKKFLILLIALIAISCSKKSGNENTIPGWTVQESGTKRTMHSVYFTDRYTGYIA
jgi:hypothetical protein